jgi:hypothetical protein
MIKFIPEEKSTGLKVSGVEYNFLIFIISSYQIRFIKFN